MHLTLPGVHVAAAVELRRADPQRGVIVHHAERVVDAVGVEEVRPGVSCRSAQRMAPAAQFVPLGELVGAEVYRAVWDALLEVGPAVEPTSRQAGYVDVRGCLPKRGAKTYLGALSRRLQRLTGQPPAWGVATTKLVARYASPYRHLVGDDEAVGFLHGQRVRPGRDLARPTVRTLSDLGCRRWGQVAAVPEPRLYSLFGVQGVWLHRWSRGIDPRPVLPRWPPPAETVRAEVEPDEEGLWIAVLGQLVGVLAGRLDRRGEAAGEVALGLGRKGDQQRFGRRLDRPIHGRERLGEVVLGLLPLDLDPTAVDEVRITLRGLRPRGSAQMLLFDDPSDERARLLAGAIAQVRQRYGLLRLGTAAELGAGRERLAELIQREEGWLP